MQVAVVQCPNGLKPRQYPEGTIVFAACGLGIQVAPQQYGGKFRVQSVSAREYAAQPVHDNRATSRLAPANKELSALPVEIREGQAAHAPLGGSTD